MDRVVLMALRLAVAARENLLAELAAAPRDRDFAATLAAVWDTRLLSLEELQQATGLGRSRVYELLEEGRRDRPC